MNDFIMPVAFLIFVGLFLMQAHQVRVAQKNLNEAIKLAEDWQRLYNDCAKTRNEAIKLLDNICTNKQ